MPISNSLFHREPLSGRWSFHQIAKFHSTVRTSISRAPFSIITATAIPRPFTLHPHLPPSFYLTTLVKLLAPVFSRVRNICSFSPFRTFQALFAIPTVLKTIRDNRQCQPLAHLSCPFLFTGYAATISVQMKCPFHSTSAA